MRWTPVLFCSAFAMSTRPIVPRGAFIVFEGIDRCGKTTQCKYLQEHLAGLENDSKVVAENIRFPNRESCIGGLINSYLQSSSSDINDNTIHLLFSANRWEAKDSMLQKLEAGVSLVCDRYAYSGVAFSSAKGMDMEWCCDCDRGLPAPDCVIYLDMPVEDAAKRGNYGEERYEKVDFQKKVRERFMMLKEKDHEEGIIPWFVLNADRSIEEVQRDINTIVDPIVASCKNGKPIGSLWK